MSRMAADKGRDTFFGDLRACLLMDLDLDLDMRGTSLGHRSRLAKVLG